MVDPVDAVAAVGRHGTGHSMTMYPDPTNELKDNMEYLTALTKEQTLDSLSLSRARIDVLGTTVTRLRQDVAHLTVERDSAVKKSHHLERKAMKLKRINKRLMAEQKAVILSSSEFRTPLSPLSVAHLSGKPFLAVDKGDKENASVVSSKDGDDRNNSPRVDGEEAKTSAVFDKESVHVSRVRDMEKEMEKLSSQRSEDAKLIGALEREVDTLKAQLNEALERDKESERKREEEGLRSPTVVHTLCQTATPSLTNTSTMTEDHNTETESLKADVRVLDEKVLVLNNNLSALEASKRLLTARNSTLQGELSRVLSALTTEKDEREKERVKHQEVIRFSREEVSVLQHQLYHLSQLDVEHKRRTESFMKEHVKKSEEIDKALDTVRACESRMQSLAQDRDKYKDRFEQLSTRIRSVMDSAHVKAADSKQQQQLPQENDDEWTLLELIEHSWYLLKEENKKLIDIKDELKKKCEAQEDQVKGLTDEAKALAQNIDLQREDVRKSERTTRALEDLMSEQQNCLEEAREEIDMLKSQRDEWKREAQHMKTQFDSATAVYYGQLEAGLSAVDKTTGELERLRLAETTSEAEKMSLRQELLTVQGLCGELEGKMNAANRERHRREEEHKHRVMELEALKEEGEAATQQLKLFREELEKTSKDLSEVRKSELEFRSLVVDEKRRCSELTQEVRRWEEISRELSERNTIQMTAVVESDSRCCSLQKEVSDLEDQIYEMAREMINLQDELAGKEAVRAAVAKTVRSVSLNLSQVKTGALELKEDVSAMTGDINSSFKEGEKQLLALGDVVSRTEEEMRSSVNKQHSQRSKAQSELNATKRQLADLLNKCQQLEKSRKATERKYESFESMITEQIQELCIDFIGEEPLLRQASSSKCLQHLSSTLWKTLVGAFGEDVVARRDPVESFVAVLECHSKNLQTQAKAAKEEVTKVKTKLDFHRMQSKSPSPGVSSPRRQPSQPPPTTSQRPLHSSASTGVQCDIGASTSEDVGSDQVGSERASVDQSGKSEQRSPTPQQRQLQRIRDKNSNSSSDSLQIGQLKSQVHTLLSEKRLLTSRVKELEKTQSLHTEPTPTPTANKGCQASTDEHERAQSPSRNELVDMKSELMVLRAEKRKWMAQQKGNTPSRNVQSPLCHQLVQTMDESSSDGETQEDSEVELSEPNHTTKQTPPDSHSSNVPRRQLGGKSSVAPRPPKPTGASREVIQLRQRLQHRKNMLSIHSNDSNKSKMGPNHCESEPMEESGCESEGAGSTVSGEEREPGTDAKENKTVLKEKESISPPDDASETDLMIKCKKLQLTVRELQAELGEKERKIKQLENQWVSKVKSNGEFSFAMETIQHLRKSLETAATEIEMYKEQLTRLATKPESRSGTGNLNLLMRRKALATVVLELEKNWGVEGLAFGSVILNMMTDFERTVEEISAKRNSSSFRILKDATNELHSKHYPSSASKRMSKPTPGVEETRRSLSEFLFPYSTPAGNKRLCVSALEHTLTGPWSSPSTNVPSQDGEMRSGHTTPGHMVHPQSHCSTDHSLPEGAVTERKPTKQLMEDIRRRMEFVNKGPLPLSKQ